MSRPLSQGASEEGGQWLEQSSGPQWWRDVRMIRYIGYSSGVVSGQVKLLHTYHSVRADHLLRALLSSTGVRAEWWSDLHMIMYLLELSAYWNCPHL